MAPLSVMFFFNWQPDLQGNASVVQIHPPYSSCQTRCCARLCHVLSKILHNLWHRVLLGALFIQETLKICDTMVFRMDTRVACWEINVQRTVHSCVYDNSFNFNRQSRFGFYSQLVKKVSAIMQVNITVTFDFVTVLKVLFEVKMQLGFWATAPSHQVSGVV